MSVTGEVAAGGAGGASLGPRLGAASRSSRSWLFGDAAGSAFGTRGEVAAASATAGCGIPRHALQGGRLARRAACPALDARSAAAYSALLADVDGAQLVAAKGVLVGGVENLVHNLVLQRRARANTDGLGPASATACSFATCSGSSAAAAAAAVQARTGSCCFSTVTLAGTGAVWSKNLSLVFASVGPCCGCSTTAVRGGAARCVPEQRGVSARRRCSPGRGPRRAAVLLTTQFSPAPRTPQLGRTRYIFGAVVLTLNAIRSALRFVTVTVWARATLNGRWKRSTCGSTWIMSVALAARGCGSVFSMVSSPAVLALGRRSRLLC